MKSNIWYYRFDNEDNGFLWSGRISSSLGISLSQAKHFIRKKHNMAKLPARTIILSEFDLKD